MKGLLVVGGRYQVAVVIIVEGRGVSTDLGISDADDPDQGRLEEDDTHVVPRDDVELHGLAKHGDPVDDSGDKSPSDVIVVPIAYLVIARTAPRGVNTPAQVLIKDGQARINVILVEVILRLTFNLCC